MNNVRTATMNKRSRVQNESVELKAYSARELAHFRELILRQKAEVLEDLEILNESMAASGGMNNTDGTDQFGLSFYEQSAGRAASEHEALLIDRQTRYLKSLEAALGRIKDGTYGLCTRCGVRMERERLEAVPNAQYCVPCKL
jgi:RNA polymerase-binding transcription factor DksA